MAHAAQQPTQSGSEGFDPNNGKYPKEGITGDQLSQLDPSIAVPACNFSDNLWWNRNRYRILERIKLSQQSYTLTHNEITYTIPLISLGCLYPVKIPFGGVYHGEIDLDGRITRNGLTPSFCPTKSTVSPDRNFPLIEGNYHLGNEMGLCPLWIKTPNGTNRYKIVENLKKLTYYVLVYDPCKVPQRMSFDKKYVKWNPIVWDMDSDCNLVHPSPDWNPSHNMIVEKRPSPLARRDTTKQIWVRPEPRTKIPGCSIGRVPITTNPCGVFWKKGVGYVCVRSKTGVYLGAQSTMKVSSWGEYNQNYKGRSFRIEIDCSASVQFSENAFDEGYNWDEDNEQWVLCVFDDSDSDDGDSDYSDYSDPMDDCSDCGDSRCPCQYNRK